MIKTATGCTPFALAFGLEAITPSELVWILEYEEGDNEEMQIDEDNRERLHEEIEERKLKCQRRMA